jgi:hypothetical protein
MAEIKLDVASAPSNSNKYKQTQVEREEVRKVVNRENVVTTKKSVGRKFVDTFIQEDAEDIKSYVLFDVIIPGIKNLVLDIAEMAFFGTSGGSDRGRKSKSSDRTDYKSYYGGYTRSSRERDRDRRRTRDRGSDRSGRDDKLDYQSIILKNREDAEDLIDEMRHRINKFGSCSIAELFDMIDEPSNYNDNNWGWEDERDISLRRVSKGYLIDVVKAYYLDD